MARVTCQVSLFCGQSGGPSRGSVCYQRGLPRLVYPVSREVLQGATLMDELTGEKHNPRGPVGSTQ